MRRRFGRGKSRRGGRTYGGAVGLAIAALGIGALVMLVRARGAARENGIEEALETVKGQIKEVVTALKENDAKKAEGRTDREKGTAEETKDELRRIIRESVRKSGLQRYLAVASACLSREFCSMFL